MRIRMDMMLLAMIITVALSIISPCLAWVAPHPVPTRTTTATTTALLQSSTTLEVPGTRRSTRGTTTTAPVIDEALRQRFEEEAVLPRRITRTHRITNPPNTKEETSLTLKKKRENHFDDWIANAPKEITEWQDVTVIGQIPDYVQGTLVRNGGAHWGGGNDETDSPQQPPHTSSSSTTNEELAHLFDGMAKISAYRINGKTQQVQFQNPFVQSKFYQKFQATGKIPTAFGVGPRVVKEQQQQQQQQPEQRQEGEEQCKTTTITTKRVKFGKRRLLQALANLPIFDNACVNVWDFDPLGKRRNQEPASKTKTTTRETTTITGEPTISTLTDASPRAVLSLSTLQTLSSSNMAPTRLKKMGKGIWNRLRRVGYPIIETAHPMYSLESDDTYNVAVTLSMPRGRPVLTLLKETPFGERRVVGSCPMRQKKKEKNSEKEHEKPKQEEKGIPYVHSFGLSEKYAVVVVQPLRFHLFRNLKGLLEKGLLQSMESIDHTRVIVFELETGKVVMDQSMTEPVYFFHTVSTVENDKDKSVSIRLAGYRQPEIKCGMRHTQERASIPKGAKFVDITCNLEEQKVSVDWIELENANPCFELPMTRYLRAHGGGGESSDLPPREQHPDFVYAFGAALGNKRGEAHQENDYNAWALHKYNPNRRILEGTFEKDNWYFSEPIFVANPKGSREDDGVLLSQIYDGERRETALVVLDARDMSQVALAWTGTRCPMDFHGGFFPSKDDAAPTST